MKNIFSFKRFMLLLKKTLLERPTQMFGFTGLILALVVMLYVAAKLLAGIWVAQNLTFIWGLPGGSFLLASLVFGYFSTNANGSSYLTLPASAFEKWLCAVLITGVFYPILFILFFHGMDLIFVAIYHNGLDPAANNYKQNYDAVYAFDFNGMLARKVYPVFLFLTGAMLTGSLYFNKVSFIKTGILLCGLCFGLFAINWSVASLLFGHVNDAFPFSHVTLPVGKEEGVLEFSDGVSNIVNYSLSFIIPAILWILSYTRLREKEF